MGAQSGTSRLISVRTLTMFEYGYEVAATVLSAWLLFAMFTLAAGRGR